MGVVGETHHIADEMKKKHRRRTEAWEAFYTKMGREYTEGFLSAHGWFWQTCARFFGSTRYAGARAALAALEQPKP
jgi:hypothetical protein